jgi:hypothetical protein
MQYSFSKFLVCRCSSVVVSSKVGKEKSEKEKRVWRQFCEWLSASVACVPAAVSLLLLENLFMQISGVSLTLTWPCRLFLLNALLCANCCYMLSPFQAHWGRWHCTCFLRPACLFTAHVGSGSSPLSYGVFLPPPLLQAFLLLFAGHVPWLLPSLAQLVYLQFCEGFPSAPFWCSGCSTLFATCLFCCYCLLFSCFFLFSLGGGRSVWGLCWSGSGLSVGVPRTA